MSSRYRNTERLGVIATDQIVTKHFGWIFREQPITDVGIDALIEHSEGGNPMGRFIAIQIKSGKSNFHISENYLTYYVSRIHHNYWLNLAIPIILVAHLPETDKTYWQHLCEKNFKKTDKRWKIEIPKKQEFNANAKNKLLNIFSDTEDKSFVFDLFKGKVESDTLFDFVENISCIDDSVDTVNNMCKIILELGDKSREFNLRIAQCIENGLSDKHSQVKAIIRGYGKNLNICSRRLESELELFCSLFSEGFYAYEQIVLLHYLITKDPDGLTAAYIALEKIPKSVDTALEGISRLRDGISKLSNNYSVLREAKKTLLDVIGLLINEFAESKEMAIKIMDKIELER